MSQIFMILRVQTHKAQRAVQLDWGGQDRGGERMAPSFKAWRSLLPTGPSLPGAPGSSFSLQSTGFLSCTCVQEGGVSLSAL